MLINPEQSSLLIKGYGYGGQEPVSCQRGLACGVRGRRNRPRGQLRSGPGSGSTAPQARHQARMSWLLGVFDAMFYLADPGEVLVRGGGQRPAREARVLAAGLGRRAPSSSSACLAELEGTVLTVRDGQLPYGLEGRLAQLDIGALVGEELARIHTVAGVGQEHQSPGIEEEIVPGKRS